jgi:hypothetical protein
MLSAELVRVAQPIAIQRDSPSPMAARTGIPVPLAIYDKTPDVLKNVVARAKLDASINTLPG